MIAFDFTGRLYEKKYFLKLRRNSFERSDNALTKTSNSCTNNDKKILYSTNKSKQRHYLPCIHSPTRSLRKCGPLVSWLVEQAKLCATVKHNLLLF